MAVRKGWKAIFSLNVFCSLVVLLFAVRFFYFSIDLDFGMMTDRDDRVRNNDKIR